MQYSLHRIARIWLPYAVVWISLATIIFLIRGDLPKNLNGLVLLPFGESPSLIPQGWTLSIEILLSSLLPINLLFKKNNKKITVRLLILSLLLPGPGAFLFHFILGQYTYLYLLDQKSGVAWCALALGFLLYTAQSSFGYHQLAPNKYFMFITACGSAMIISAIHNLNFLKKYLTCSILLRLGSISYSIYLLHFIIITKPITYIIDLLNKSTYLQKFSLVWPFGLIVTLILVSFVAYPFHVLIEIPILKFANKKIKNSV